MEFEVYVFMKAHCLISNYEQYHPHKSYFRVAGHLRKKTQKGQIKMFKHELIIEKETIERKDWSLSGTHTQRQKHVLTQAHIH